MKKTTVAVALIAMFLVPAGAVAQPNDDDVRAATTQCKRERGQSSATREAFKDKYGSMARCLGRKAAEEEGERKEARKNAAQECRDERGKIGTEAFAEEYGKNENGKNAFGKCVSMKAKAKKAEMDEADAEKVAKRKRAARECDGEREKMGRQAFAEKHGKNESDKNAFGNCVSRTARDS